MNTVHLICNAHIDPVWLWDWEEGISATLSTFRSAAKFCREYEGFIFNHNEALLYQWVEQYDPTLFEEIRALVRAGSWQIIGGWYLQPDCNMPSGESILRQIRTGRAYFQEKFGVTPTTAVNFDSFGHNRGLVQILRKSGYDSYLFCRPLQDKCELPSDDFLWEGYDGSRVLAHRSSEHYNSLIGEAGKKLTRFLSDRNFMRQSVTLQEEERPQEGLPQGSKPDTLFLWGVGNHGGGPSREDLGQLHQMNETLKEVRLIHSTPEAFFEAIQRTLVSSLFRENDSAGRNQKRNKDNAQFPVVSKSLNPQAPGCYTSQIRIKRLHRQLEAMLAMTEKMLLPACVSAGMQYPKDDMAEAERALLTCEFHDILPGSGVKMVEESAIRLLDYGLERLAKVRREAFFRMLQGQRIAGEGEYPVFLYNPHPYAVSGIFSFELQMQNQNWSSTFGMPVMDQIPCQCEKASCHMNLDWVKKVSFFATLQPMQMNRFPLHFVFLPEKPKVSSPKAGEDIVFVSERLQIRISGRTGLVQSLCMDGTSYLAPDALRLEVRDGGFDPWGMNVRGFPKKVGAFSLLSKEEAAAYAGLDENAGSARPLRIIEDGLVRTIVEAMFGYRNSRALVHYILPKYGTEIDVDIRIDWQEKGKLLKWMVPVAFPGNYAAEAVFGSEAYAPSTDEQVMHRWSGVFSKEGGKGTSDISEPTGNRETTENTPGILLLSDSCYGTEFQNNTVGISMIHSAAYAGHPIEDRPMFEDDRWINCEDQGERHFRFRIIPGDSQALQDHASQYAVNFLQLPVPICVFPAGEEQKTNPFPAIEFNKPCFELTGVRYLEEEKCWELHVFESSGHDGIFQIRQGNAILHEQNMKAFEVAEIQLVL